MKEAIVFAIVLFALFQLFATQPAIPPPELPIPKLAPPPDPPVAHLAPELPTVDPAYHNAPKPVPAVYEPPTTTPPVVAPEPEYQNETKIIITQTKNKTIIDIYID